VMESYLAERKMQNVLPTGEIDEDRTILGASISEIEDGIERLTTVAESSRTGLAIRTRRKRR